MLAACFPTHAEPTVCSFDEGEEATPYTTMTDGRGSRISTDEGAVRLLHGRADTSAGIVFNRTSRGMHREVHASFTLAVPEGPGGDGGSVLLLDTSVYGTEGGIDLPDGFAWEEPNLRSALGIAFDIHNPPGGGPFNRLGNIYDRPQREVSIHWNGWEIANTISPAEFRTGEPVEVEATLRFEPGGAFLDLNIAGEPVYERLLIAGMTPYEMRAAFGARSGDYVTMWDIDDVSIEFTEPMARPMPSPLRVNAFRREFVSSKNQKPKRSVNFRAVPGNTARVIATLSLEEPDVGFDPWDKSAAVYIWDESGERHELLRFITPFGRGWEWKVDVTDMLPLLKGRPEMGLWIETYRNGWLVSLDLDFYPAVRGEAFEMPVGVTKLWSGKPEIGNTEKPVSDFYTPMEVEIPDNATRAECVVTVTGHGMMPNTDNAGEFMPINRTLRAEGPGGSLEETSTLWKEDVYLNPCRPQGGTWKYDRAGWAPGDVVRPWRTDLSKALGDGGMLLVEYELDDYVNENKGQTWDPFHWTEGRIVFWRTVEP